MLEMNPIEQQYLDKIRELKRQNKRYRHSLKRIRLACNFSEEDKEEIVPTIYEEVNKALEGKKC